MGIPSYMPWNLGMTLGITLSYTWLILCMRTRLVLDHNLARAPIIGSIPTYPIGYQKNQFWYITVILKNITTSKNRPENHECFVGCLMVSRKRSTLQRFLKQPRTSHSLILKKIWKTWTHKCVILKYLRTQLTHFLVSEINFLKRNSRVLGYKL